MVADALTRQALQLVASVTKTGAPKASMARLRGMVAAGPVAVWIRQGPLVMRQLAEALRASRLREQELEA